MPAAKDILWQNSLHCHIQILQRQRNSIPKMRCEIIMPDITVLVSTSFNIAPPDCPHHFRRLNPKDFFFQTARHWLLALLDISIQLC